MGVVGRARHDLPLVEARKLRDISGNDDHRVADDVRIRLAAATRYGSVCEQHG